MEILKYFFAGTLFLFGLFIVFCSYTRQVVNYRNRHKEDTGWSSPAPVAGPLFIIVGYAMLPLPWSNWIFLVFVLDPDTVICLIGLPNLFRELLTKE